MLRFPFLVVVLLRSVLTFRVCLLVLMCRHDCLLCVLTCCVFLCVSFLFKRASAAATDPTKRIGVVLMRVRCNGEWRQGKEASKEVC